MKRYHPDDLARREPKPSEKARTYIVNGVVVNDPTRSRFRVLRHVLQSVDMSSIHHT